MCAETAMCMHAPLFDGVRACVLAGCPPDSARIKSQACRSPCACLACLIRQPAYSGNKEKQQTSLLFFGRACYAAWTRCTALCGGHVSDMWHAESATRGACNTEPTMHHRLQYIRVQCSPSPRPRTAIETGGHMAWQRATGRHHGNLSVGVWGGACVQRCKQQSASCPGNWLRGDTARQPSRGTDSQRGLNRQRTQVAAQILNSLTESCMPDNTGPNAPTSDTTPPVKLSAARWGSPTDTPHCSGVQPGAWLLALNSVHAGLGPHQHAAVPTLAVAGRHGSLLAAALLACSLAVGGGRHVHAEAAACRLHAPAHRGPHVGRPRRVAQAVELGGAGLAQQLHRAPRAERCCMVLVRGGAHVAALGAGRQANGRGGWQHKLSER